MYLSISKVSATDADDDLNGRVLYFLSREAHGAFSVDESTGAITTSAPLDREKQASYSFQVFAVDLSPAEPRNTSAQVNEGLEVQTLKKVLKGVFFNAHYISNTFLT